MLTEEGTEPVQNSGQLLILAVFVVFAVWVLSRGRRQQRETQLTQSRVRVGTEVMMTSGLYGRVVEVADDTTIRVETSPGIVSRWDRRAVARIISSPEEATENPPAAEVAEAETPTPAEPVEPVPPAEPAVPNRDAAPPDRD
jgi:preprotein translocase subunit YajC